MQTANSLHWTTDDIAAAQVALGAPDRPSTWYAPVDPVEALAADTGGKAVQVEAYLNHGRWVVECPDCHGAQLASPTDRRFMCNCCANVVAGGVFRPVVWPKNVAKIEALVQGRPLDAQNWTPGESLAFLRAENEWFGGGI